METTLSPLSSKFRFCLPSRRVDVPKLRCRKAELQDVAELTEIENLSFDSPWSAREFEYCIADKRCEGALVEEDGEVLGYLFYEINNASFSLLNCAVSPFARRRGAGTLLLRELISRLGETRKEISCVVRESNVQAQVFLRSLGFRAQWVMKGFYSDSKEDAYKMSFQTEDWALATEYIRKRLLTR